MKSDLTAAFEEVIPYLANIWKVRELLETISFFEAEISSVDLVNAVEDLIRRQDVQNDVTLVTDLKIVINRLLKT